MDNDRELFEIWYKNKLINKYKLTEQEANTYLKWVESIGYVHKNAARRFEGFQAALSHNKERIAELEKDAERLKLLMTMSGEMYQESIKFQFVGRLREFIDANKAEIDKAMKGE